MIHKYKLHGRVPTKKILSLFTPNQDNTENTTSDWTQIVNNDPEMLLLVSKLLNIKINKINNCVLHYITGDVESHADRYSHRVYIIPLKYTKTCCFYDEDQSTTFKPKYAYKFNDHNWHGLYNPYQAHIIILTVDCK